MGVPSFTCSLGFVRLPSCIRLPPPSFWRLLSQNREERVLRHEAREEPAPQGRNPQTRYARDTRPAQPKVQPCLRPRDQTPPLRRQRPNRLSCDWPAEPFGRGLASHWLAGDSGPHGGPRQGSFGRRSVEPRPPPARAERAPAQPACLRKAPPALFAPILFSPWRSLEIFN